MALRNKITKNQNLTSFEGRIPMNYRYTFGLAGESFFRKLKEGKLTASVAKQSGVVYCPPRIFCEDSFEEISETIELSGEGIVESYTVSCEDIHGDAIEPEIIALVKFDETEGGFAAPLKCEIEDAYIGMPVKLAFIPKNQRKGAITDVYFVPDE
ncbi:MAG: Zn-ribbon domain-containing OB-fold protein [Phycisphaerae bacterium]|nr:Zn-ribbon domain-containing OB-fold protein [Phycisphaerae bacterium]